MLIVTAYYNIPSKQPKENYINYIKLFFNYIKDNKVIFFTDNENYIELKPFAGENIEFQILKFEELSIFNDFSVDFWKQQIEIDPEKYHTWQLGALWANKSRFVKKASEIDPNHDWYMWVDAGCVRKEEWEPVLKKFGKANHSLLKTGVYIQSLNNNIPNKDCFTYKYGVDYIAGSHILFHKDYIDIFIDKYTEIVYNYIKNNAPVIMDQYIITSMSLKFDFIHSIIYDKSMNAIDRWFFFFHVF